MTMMDGAVLNSVEEVHNGAAQYFQNFLTINVEVEQGNLNLILEHVIMEEDNQMLCIDPTEAKIKDALSSITKQSNLRLDWFGFTCWDFIKDHVIKATRGFFCGSHLPRFYGASFIF